MSERYPNDKPWDASGQVLAPGFVNTHTHLYGVLAYGIPLDQAPFEFIKSCSMQPGLVSGLARFHITFTCSAEFIRQAFAMVHEPGALVHMHCSGAYEP